MESSEPFDVLLIGFGAVGGVYAYVLEQSKRCRVTAIARSLYSSMSRNGVTIKSEKFGEIKNWKPYRLTSTAEEAADRKYRFIICSFKCLPDVNPTSSILAPFMIPHTEGSTGPNYEHHSPTVVLIQNGIGIEQPLAEAFPSIHIISCVAWIGANLITPKPGPEKQSSKLLPNLPQEEPIIIHGRLEKLVFGLYEGEGFAPVLGNEPDDPSLKTCNQFVEGILADDLTPLVGEKRMERIRRGKKEVQVLSDVLRAGGGETEVLEHIQPARWAKNLWNGAFSTMCTLARSPVSALTAQEVLPYVLPVVRRTMLEILYVARALGYTEADFPAQSIDDAIQVTINHYQIKKPGSDQDLKKSDLKPSDQLKDPKSSNGLPSEPNDNVFDDDEDNEDDGKALGEDESVTAVFKPSTLIDLEEGRPMELEPIVGAVLDRARAKAIETPRLDLVYSALKISQAKAVQAYAKKLKTQEQEIYTNKWAMRKPSVSGSGTSGRQAWLDEVKRLADLNGGGGGGILKDESVMGKSKTSLGQLPSKDSKVTGKPLKSSR